MSEPRDPNDPFPPLDPFPGPPANPFPPLGQELQPRSDWIEGANPHDLPTRENRLIALGRFAFPPAPPLDDEGVAARDQRWTGRTIVFVTAFMLIFNAVSIQDWARQQPPGWLTTTVGQLADVWTQQLALLGADQPKAGVKDAWTRWRASRFVGQGESR